MSNSINNQNPERGGRPEQQNATGPEGRASEQNGGEKANPPGKQLVTGILATVANRPGALIAAVAGGLAVLALVVYLLISASTSPSGPQAAPTTAGVQPGQRAPAAQPTQQPSAGGEPALTSLFGARPAAPDGSDSLLVVIARIALRLALAALLAAVLVFRPRKNLPIIQRNPYVMQSQILLSVVAAALMMVVADNAARAFGIFAAASLVRFRTIVRDPKEITVLLVGLGVGLASGVGRWEIAVILTVFVMLMLLVLEYYEPVRSFRTMGLTVVANNIDSVNEILKETFDKYQIVAEARKVDRESEDKGPAVISYSVSLDPNLSIDRLSDEIISSDPDNVVSVKWDQKKSASYTYR